MKPRFFPHGSLLAAASTLCLLGSHQSHAATLWWDGTSTTGDADGGTGTWSTASAWDNAATGGANATWNNATPDSAVFGGAAATVTLSGTQTANTIQIDTGRYLITGSTLTINSGITLSSGSGNAAPVSGGSASGFTDISSAVTLGGSQIWTNNSSDTVLRQLTGNVNLGVHTLTLKTTGNKNVVVAGTTSGSGSIIVDTNSLASMSGNNSYGGTTTIKSGGILTINSLTNSNAASGLGNKTNNLASNLVIDGGTLRVQVSSSTSDRLFTVGAGGAAFEAVNTGANSGQILLTGATAITYSGTGDRNITLGGISDDVGGSSIARTIGDVGGGNGIVSLVKNGTHAWTVSGTNSYSGGTTVSDGTLTMGSAGALGSTSGQLTVNTGGTLNMAGQNLTVGNLTGTGGFISGTSGSRTLTIGQGDNGGGDYQGQINNGAGGTTALTKTGTGTITLSGTNGYTGATDINGGTLLLAATGSTASGSAVTVASGATLGGTGTVNGTLAATGSIAPGISGIGTLKSGDVTWNGGGVSSNVLTDWKFNLGAGNTSDKLEITGNFIQGSGTGFWVDFQNSNVNGTFDLVSWTGSLGGGFTVGDVSMFNYTNLGGGRTGTFALTANSLSFTAIPEPTSALAGLLLGAGLLRRRRTA